MRLIIIMLNLSIVLLSCHNRKEAPHTNAPLTEEDQPATGLDQIKLGFHIPVLIDSSEYVMYPLYIDRGEKERGFSSGSYAYPGPMAYWNIIFYNVATGAYHLLDDQRKMVIHTYTGEHAEARAPSSSDDSREYLAHDYTQVDRLLYYAVTTTDFNQDGQLTTVDPRYLFISDRSGKNFQQISPDTLDVTNWQTIRETNKILIQVTKDNNNDKKFDDKDESIPMVYDLGTPGFSKEVFQEEFKIKLRKQIKEQGWKRE